jgi:hypothetical protein
MNPLSKLLDDLRRKRLLPVAALLIAAAVAIPVIIGGGGDAGATDASAVVAVPGPAADARPSVELVGPPTVRSRPGKVRDPFRRAKTTAKASESSATPAASSASSGSSKSGGTSSASSAAKPAATKSKPAVSSVATASKAARTVYRTTARFKGAVHDYAHPLEILDVFGDADNPAAQYAGVAAGGEYAIFLLGPNATAHDEDGACIVADPCRAIGLRRGEKLRVAVAFEGAATRHYVIAVTGLRRVVKRTAAAARAYRRDFDVLGRDVLKSISADADTAATLRQMRYSRRSGTVSLLAAP